MDDPLDAFRHKTCSVLNCFNHFFIFNQKSFSGWDSQIVIGEQLKVFASGGSENVKLTRWLHHVHVHLVQRSVNLVQQGKNVVDLVKMW